MASSPESANPASDSTPEVFRFRLVHLLYLVTLLSVSLAVFGVGGFWVGAIVAGYWLAVYGLVRSTGASYGRVILISLAILLAIEFVMPVTSQRRAPATGAQCMGNLASIALALDSYHQRYNAYPPAYLADADGRPAHSWRVLVLPYLDQQGLYDAYRFDEPWDGPHNRRLLDSMPKEFACPSHSDVTHSHCTSYLAVCGPRTMWPGPISRSAAEVKDGLSRTALVVETSEPAVPWLEPRDLSLEEALKIVSEPGQPETGHRASSYIEEHSSNRRVVYGDRHTEIIPHGTDAQDWRAMLTIDDGAPAFEPAYDDARTSLHSWHRIRWGNCLRLVAFAVTVLWPFKWFWQASRKRRIGAPGPGSVRLPE